MLQNQIRNVNTIMLIDVKSFSDSISEEANYLITHLKITDDILLNNERKN